MRAAENSAGIAYRFYRGADPEPESWRYGELWARCAAIAQRLQEKGLAGERVLLVCKSQAHFVAGFYACLLAGCIAVPTAPPQREALLGRLTLLADDAQPRALMADSDQLLAMAALPGMAALLPIDLRTGGASADNQADALRYRPTSIGAESLAFLQYTSGSTDAPKGVAVTHANIVHNCATIANAMAITSGSAILTALPLFHDMGLIGGLLVAMYVGCPASFMAPVDFIQHPERWLHVVSAEGITHSGGPNYMYDLVARTVQPEHLSSCDLSGWQVAFCGAEPIRASTMANFSSRFATAGFRSEAFYPCYGMAEATLLITGHRAGTQPVVSRQGEIAVVGCGRPAADMALCIVDPATLLPLGAGHTGEIWVSGASVANGYWRRPQLSEEIFHARLAGDERHYLRTGDLGYIEDGNLFVTGRLKDLVIIYGKNYAPHELEATAELSNEILSSAASAAFNVTDDTSSRLVMVCEIKRSWLRQPQHWPAAVRAMRSAVMAQHGVHIDEVVLIKPGVLPRTSSGKVRRSQCRLDYLAGALAQLPLAA